ncbi:MAG: hypothetical protein P8K83_02915 [Woeseiaceae bacterium]|nr:hypothetical protein [Woeseiaceae bacterium]
MTDTQKFESRKSAVIRKSDGNPEGKGLNGLLSDWSHSRPTGVVAKPRRQLLAEIFTSMLILSAAFKFRPVVGVANFLYLIDGEWSLSLIAPDEWSLERRAGFAGTCVLQRDMTWTIIPSELLALANPVSNAIGRFYDGFAETLNTDLSLEEILPFYVDKLPYYQRLYASALSRSVQTSVILGNDESSSCRDWYTQLPALVVMEL